VQGGIISLFLVGRQTSFIDKHLLICHVITKSWLTSTFLPLQFCLAESKSSRSRWPKELDLWSICEWNKFKRGNHPAWG
jgi:hypothetical protein